MPWKQLWEGGSPSVSNRCPRHPFPRELSCAINDIAQLLSKRRKLSLFSLSQVLLYLYYLRDQSQSNLIHISPSVLTKVAFFTLKIPTNIGCPHICIYSKKVKVKVFAIIPRCTQSSRTDRDHGHQGEVPNICHGQSPHPIKYILKCVFSTNRCFVTLDCDIRSSHMFHRRYQNQNPQCLSRLC